MKKKYFVILLILILAMTAFAGCGSDEPAASEESVVLTVAGSWPDCRALDTVAAEFTTEYPNCTINYEYLQDYYPSLSQRMEGENPVDLFFTTNIQADSDMLPYALDLNSCEELDLSRTFEGLIENFAFREENGDATKLYAVPLGAQMRGLYVNTTLLASLDLEVPTDQASLLAACQVLQDNGYIPFHGNPGDFSQTLIYPWICNLIANADDPEAAYDRVNAREPGVSEMFREPYAFLYSLVEKYFYEYKRAETELGLFTETSEEDYARYFLNIESKDDSWVKTDDLGQVAFMPSPISLQSVIDKTKEDYHSEIEYVFMPAPIGVDGGYAYLSPSHGIAINNASAQSEWAVKFLDFLFQPENNTIFCEAFNVIPNTEEAFSYIASLYDLPDNHICELGQVTFDYGFYDLVTPSLLDISKANNPKYMQDDGNGELSIYPLDHFMEELENSFQEQ